MAPADLPMFRLIRVILVVLLVLVLAGTVLPLLIRSRENSDRVVCQNHLRELGLIGVRHAAVPGQALPARPRDELPPGTLLNPDLPPDRRLSWYAYLLMVLNEGVPNLDPQIKHRPPSGLPDLVSTLNPAEPWDSGANRKLATYRLAVALCPAVLTDRDPGHPSPTNYVASGGLGLETPTLTPDAAGPQAGAFWYDGPTPDRLFRDGLSQTAQILETNREPAPWLQGGPGTLRGLDEATGPYIGSSRPFGGCHADGVYVSMADGAVRVVAESVDPIVFRALLTRAGGPDELGAGAP